MVAHKRAALKSKISPELKAEIKARREFIHTHDFYAVPDGHGEYQIDAVPRFAR